MVLSSFPQDVYSTMEISLSGQLNGSVVEAHLQVRKEQNGTLEVFLTQPKYLAKY